MLTGAVWQWLLIGLGHRVAGGVGGEQFAAEVGVNQVLVKKLGMLTLKCGEAVLVGRLLDCNHHHMCPEDRNRLVIQQRHMMHPREALDAVGDVFESGLPPSRRRYSHAMRIWSWWRNS